MVNQNQMVNHLDKSAQCALRHTNAFETQIMLQKRREQCKVYNSKPGPPNGSDSICVKARWFRAVSVAAVPRALLLLLAASTEMPLSDSVGLDVSLHTFCSDILDIM